MISHCAKTYPIQQSAKGKLNSTLNRRTVYKNVACFLGSFVDIRYKRGHTQMERSNIYMIHVHQRVFLQKTDRENSVSFYSIPHNHWMFLRVCSTPIPAFRTHADPKPNAYDVRHSLYFSYLFPNSLPRIRTPWSK